MNYIKAFNDHLKYMCQRPRDNFTEINTDKI